MVGKHVKKGKREVDRGGWFNFNSGYERRGCTTLYRRGGYLAK